jgi:hypothetical protein
MDHYKNLSAFSSNDWGVNLAKKTLILYGSKETFSKSPTEKSSFLLLAI